MTAGRPDEDRLGTGPPLPRRRTDAPLPRREALRRLGLLGAGFVFGIPDLRTNEDRLERIGLHLSTVADLLDEDFAGTLEEIARIGYREVEFAGYHGRDPEEVRRALVRAGLEAPASQVSFRTMMSDWERSIVAAHIIGHRYLVLDGIPSNRRQSLNAYRRAAGLFNRAAATARIAGMGFAYRNQASDLQPMEDRIPYDVLLEETDPELVRLEVDLHEMRRGGRDPVEHIEDHLDRIHLVHVKDTGADGEETLPGRGATDFSRVFARGREAGIRHYFVAHGDREAPLASIRTSYGYLRTVDF